MKRALSFLAAIIMIFSLGTVVFADGGDGSGGGSNEPLMLVSSSVAGGSTNVPTDVYITLTFSKNVVNFTVKANNMACFSMSDSAGNSVPISVIMGDDQVDPSIKRIVGIQANDLKPGETYTLYISGNVTSKIGVSLGSGTSISFTTAGELPQPTKAPDEQNKPTEDAPDASEAPDVTEAPVIEDPDAEDTVIITAAAEDPELLADTDAGDTGCALLVINAASAVLLAMVFVVTKKIEHK